MNALLNSFPANLAGIPGRLAAVILLVTILMTSQGRSQSTLGMTVAPPPSSPKPVMVTFSNQTSGVVVASWINQTGVEQQVGVMLPNQAMELSTFPGHVTVFYSGGMKLATFQAESFYHGSVFGIADPNGLPNNPFPNSIITCGTMPNGGSGSGNPGQVTLSGIEGLIQSILNGTLTGLPGAGLHPGNFPGVTPANQPDFAANLVGTNWTYVLGSNTFEFVFGTKQIEGFSHGWWPGVMWTANGKNQVQLKNIPPASLASLPPGQSAVNKIVNITFDSATTFRGVDFDGVTLISGRRK